MISIQISTTIQKEEHEAISILTNSSKVHSKANRTSVDTKMQTYTQ